MPTLESRTPGANPTREASLRRKPMFSSSDNTERHTAFIGGLPRPCDVETVAMFAQQHGPVRKIDLRCNKRSGTIGYALVSYMDDRKTKEAPLI